MADSAEARIKQRAREIGFDLCGIAPAAPPPHYDAFRKWVERGMHGGMGYLSRQAALRRSAEALLSEARSVIAVAKNYNQPPPIGAEARVARYALGRDYHKVMRRDLGRLAFFLRELVPGATTRICVDSAPILERDYAQMAGIGWFGKNTCLINSRRGSWFFLGLLLTDIALQPDSPAEGGCGTCRACIDACPTGALVLREDAPVAWLDSRRCISYLTIEHRGAFTSEQARMLHGWLFGCDVCQEVCPFNHPRANQPDRAGLTTETDFQPRPHVAAPDLRVLADLSPERFLALYAGTALMRAGVAGLRRNARALLEHKQVGRSSLDATDKEHRPFSK